jgi:uncharacterized membrane protein YhfC
MILLSIAIVVSLLITMGLPIVAGVWLNKTLKVPWRVITLGALGYFIVQALITLLFSGLSALIENGTLAFSDRSFFIAQLVISILFGALIGVIVRWAGMKYLKEPLVSLEAAYGIGVGYGGIESITRVGLPLLITFISMLSNINVDPQATTLEPEIVAQLEALWQVSALVPLAGSLERVAAFVMHITVTILILQFFVRRKRVWLGAAVGLELFINGVVVGLAEAGLAYGWVVLIAGLTMVGNVYLLYRLHAFDVDTSTAQDDSATLTL